MTMTTTRRSRPWRAGAVALSLALVGAAGLQARPITLYLAGDSTMAPKLVEKRPETGWGEMLQQYFDTTQVRVSNHARNGRSTRTFISEGRWQAIVDSLVPGDYVFIQFGHNDESVQKTDRYTPPDAYRANLARMVSDVRAKHAYPVLLTPVRRRKFDSAGTLVDTHGVYPDLVRQVAREQRVPLLDLHQGSATVLEHYGPAASTRLFLQLTPGENPNYPNGVTDNTHFRPLGAAEIARAAIGEIEASGLGLARFLRTPPSDPVLGLPASYTQLSRSVIAGH